jgi:hypothetical protein
MSFESYIEKYDGFFLEWYPTSEIKGEYGNIGTNISEFDTFEKKFSKYNVTNMHVKTYRYRDMTMIVNSDILYNVKTNILTETNNGLLCIWQIKDIQSNQFPILSKYHDESDEEINRYTINDISIDFIKNGIDRRICVNFILDKSKIKSQIKDLILLKKLFGLL